MLDYAPTETIKLVPNAQRSPDPKITGTSSVDDPCSRTASRTSSDKGLVGKLRDFGVNEALDQLNATARCRPGCDQVRQAGGDDAASLETAQTATVGSVANTRSTFAETSVKADSAWRRSRAR
jgi:hypothetical protein